MPVWHDLTKPLRASDDIMVIGITQEQHPQRCELWAQWEQVDWPILWDPFNLTGSAAVPIAMAVDEHGVVQNMRLQPQKFEQQFKQDFLAKEFPAPKDLTRRTAQHKHPQIQAMLHSKLDGQQWQKALAVLKTEAAPAAAKKAPQNAAHSAEQTAVAWFRLGVAQRMRYDSSHAHADDFQNALQSWQQALKLNPGQYIWRRRIQQWGPKLDKPYPFYNWVSQAQMQLKKRGLTPIELPVPLAAIASGGEEGAQPEAGVPLDNNNRVAIESALAWQTPSPKNATKPVSTVRVHLALRPDARHQVEWGDDVGAVEIWLQPMNGWQIEQNHLVLKAEPQLPKRRLQKVSFEVKRVQADANERVEAATKLQGTAYYYICIGADGECTYLAQEFEIELAFPAGS
ncbi:MAG: hypothetical protein HQ519_00310 [Planctomycetes bacterium]|nr:hypothetical protein [Planctomycetota bacterium]